MHVSRRAASAFVALLAAAALLGASATAGAKTLVELSGTASPPIAAFTTTARPLSVQVDVRFTTDVPNELAATVRKAVIFLPHGPRLNGRLFPSCSPKRLARMRGSRRACPKGSRLGGGKATGTAEQFRTITETIDVTVYNGPRGRSLIFWLEGKNPVAVSGMIVAPLQTLRGNRKWGYKLTLNVPDSLQEISLDTFASLRTFSTRVGGTVTVREKGRKVRHGFVEAPLCPFGALVPARAEFSFRDGTTAADDGYFGCGAPPPPGL